MNRASICIEININYISAEGWLIFFHLKSNNGEVSSYPFFVYKRVILEAGLRLIAFFFSLESLWIGIQGKNQLSIVYVKDLIVKISYTHFLCHQDFHLLINLFCKKGFFVLIMILFFACYLLNLLHYSI